jgi:hypothetical protein
MVKTTSINKQPIIVITTKSSAISNISKITISDDFGSTAVAITLKIKQIASRPRALHLIVAGDTNKVLVMTARRHRRPPSAKHPSTPKGSL